MTKEALACADCTEEAVNFMHEENKRGKKIQLRYPVNKSKCSFCNPNI